MRVCRDSAVSPVIGVMLLLALVIIFAAVLAAFAGGLTERPEGAPSVELAVYTAGSGEEFRMIFEHRGGDILTAEECRVSTRIKVADARDVESSFSADTLEYGSWRPGECLSTENMTNTARLLKVSKGTLEGYAGRSVPADVRVYHVPTNAILFSGTVLLEER